MQFETHEALGAAALRSMECEPTSPVTYTFFGRFGDPLE